MSSTPRTSVLMPAYNAEATICESVASVLAQTVADLELVVVDDGSTRNTLDRVALEADFAYMKEWAEQPAAGKRQGEVDPVRSTPAVPYALGLLGSGLGVAYAANADEPRPVRRAPQLDDLDSGAGVRCVHHAPAADVDADVSES
jgi:hypothetical protein